MNIPVSNVNSAAPTWTRLSIIILVSVTRYSRLFGHQPNWEFPCTESAEQTNYPLLSRFFTGNYKSRAMTPLTPSFLHFNFQTVG